MIDATTDDYTGWRLNNASGMIELVRNGVVLAGCATQVTVGEKEYFVYQWTIEVTQAEARRIVDEMPRVSVQPRFE